MNGPAEPRFVIDHMLVKLGKYLRILGYDAVWDLSCRTHELIGRANREGRVFVTRNTRLREQYPPVDRVMVLKETDPVRQLHALIGELALDPTARLFSKCIVCNVALDPVADKPRVRARVHPNVYARYERFYTCPHCGTVFWRGSHVRNTCRKLELPCLAEGAEGTVKS
jgi:uncharacterized protein with PIN domain